jgi:DNA end-binding protein Ku
MAARAVWKGHLEIGELVCAVALHAAASTSERIAFHILNRRTGHRVERVYVDAETGKPVERDEQGKGYTTDKGKEVVLDPEEVAAAVPESDKRLKVKAFVACDAVDTLYLNRPYHLTPADDGAETAFAVIRDGLVKSKVAAVARAVLFRRVRSLLVRPGDDGGLVAHTLEFDHEVRDAAAAFKDVAGPKIDPEMLDLAEHIIRKKRGKFDPSTFKDRYDDALAELVKAKAAGKPLPERPEPKSTEPVDLLQALRDSAKARSKTAPARKAKPPAKRASPRKKAS